MAKAPRSATQSTGASVSGRAGTRAAIQGEGLGTTQTQSVPDPMAYGPVGAGPFTGKFNEFGASGLRQFSGYVREEWLRDLIGWRGIRILREMRDNDAIIGAFFFAIEMLLRGVTFHVEGVTKSSEDQAAADFVNSCLFDMEQTWSDILSEVLTFLWFGWDVHEIVYKVRGGQTDDPSTNSQYDDGMIGWRKFAGRAQETLLHWEFDASGDTTALVQLLPTGGPLLRVPLAKALHFRTTVNKQNPEGRSLLRNAYRSWFFMKRIQEIEAVGIERDLVGIPVAYVPPEIMKATADPDAQALYRSIKSVVRDTARNEQEGFVLPMLYAMLGQNQTPTQMFKLELLTTGGRRQFDTSAIIERYEARIAGTVLADFLTLGGKTGSYALSRNKTDMFSVAVVGFLDIITSEFNRKAVPDILMLNKLPGRAKLVHGEIARRDLTEIAQYVLSLAQAGALMPDETLEADLREQAGLPSADQNAMRDVEDGEEGNGAPVDGGDDEPLPDDETPGVAGGDNPDEIGQGSQGARPGPYASAGAQTPQTVRTVKGGQARRLMRKGRVLLTRLGAPASWLH